MDKASALFYVVLVLFAITGIVTLLGLVQKVTIEKKYLTALFSALLLELIAAVLYLFSNTNFFEAEASMDELTLLRVQLPEAQREFSSNELIAALNAEVSSQKKLLQSEQQLLLLNNQLTEQNAAAAELVFRLEQKNDLIEGYKLRQAKLSDELDECQILEKHFLVRMANLNSEIAALGGSVNLDWDPENKRRIAGMLQVAFKQIGFMPSHRQPDDNPAKALTLLTEYQKAKGFGITGFLTSAVVAIIIQDYLAQQSDRQDNTPT